MNYSNEVKEKVFIGCDFALKTKWWQKVLAFVWPWYRKYLPDQSCMTFWKKKADGTMEMIDAKYY
jgi:hypothetical protein